MAIVLCLNPSEIIAILDIIVTILVGIWIGFFLQNNFTTNRAVKEYFISENQDICQRYNKFVSDIFDNNITAPKIQEWFKFMTLKIDIYEDFLKQEFIINPSILKNHNELKAYITSTEDINKCYKSKSVIFTPSTKAVLFKMQKKLSISLTKLVIDINKAKKRR